MNTPVVLRAQGFVSLRPSSPHPARKRERVLKSSAPLRDGSHASALLRRRCPWAWFPALLEQQCYFALGRLTFNNFGQTRPRIVAWMTDGRAVGDPPHRVLEQGPAVRSKKHENSSLLMLPCLLMCVSATVRKPVELGDCSLEFARACTGPRDGLQVLASITTLPSTGGLPAPVEVAGLPDGGHARDPALLGFQMEAMPGTNPNDGSALTATRPLPGHGDRRVPPL